jgi:hypothetical protein
MATELATTGYWPEDKTEPIPVTVSALITLLSTFPPDAFVVIDDADTGWLLALEEHGVSLVDNRVELSSSYSSQFTPV